MRLPYPGDPARAIFSAGRDFSGLTRHHKTFSLTERQAIRFSAYAYNLTNSVRFDPATITFNGALTNRVQSGCTRGR